MFRLGFYARRKGGWNFPGVMEKSLLYSCCLNILLDAAPEAAGAFSAVGNCDQVAELPGKTFLAELDFSVDDYSSAEAGSQAEEEKGTLDALLPRQGMVLRKCR